MLQMVQQGFYYDAFYGDLGLNDDHFKQIESGAMKAVTVVFVLLTKICQYELLLLFLMDENTFAFFYS
jgi:uncharacterized membrane protein